MLVLAVLVSVDYSGVVADIVFDTAAVMFAIGMSHIPFTALRVSSDRIRVVNWFRSYTFAVDEVKQFTMSGSIQASGLLNTLIYGDKNHVLLVTTDGRVVNVAALSLGKTDWDREGVEDLVGRLNSALPATASPRK